MFPVRPGVYAPAADALHANPSLRVSFSASLFSSMPDPNTPDTMRIGVIADVQFGAKDPEEGRDYRGALGRLAAVLPLVAEARPDLLVQLGDLIDGYPDDPSASSRDLERALEPLEGCGLPLVHVIGNHCLRVGRGALEARLGLEAPRFSRTFPGWRLVVLDTCEVSIAGRAPDDPLARRARAWLDANPQAEVPRARVWNGALDEGQLAWLAAELGAAERAGERVLVLGHHPLLLEATRERYLCWNAEEVRARLEASPAVVAYLAGHDHAGGHAVSGGVHHLTVAAVLSGVSAAVLEMGEDRIEVRGIGAVEDRTLGPR